MQKPPVVYGVCTGFIWISMVYSQVQVQVQLQVHVTRQLDVKQQLIYN